MRSHGTERRRRSRWKRVLTHESPVDDAYRYPTATSSVPGQFSFPGLVLDEYSMQTRGLPDGLYVKDLTYGGQSVLGKALRVGSAIGDAGLRVVVARDGGS